MRVSYRQDRIKTYWEKRWSAVPVDDPCGNPNVYPLKYAEMVVQPGDRILEAGCGIGRVLRYYKNKGWDVVGVDYIAEVIDRLRVVDGDIQAEVGDITRLGFDKESFNTVLAFGLYHNLETGLENALAETLRVMKKGGRLCASFRADNLENRINDWMADRKSGSPAAAPQYFHKLNLTRFELIGLLRKIGFLVDEVLLVINMPLLYRFRCFRAGTHKQFDEHLARREGYKLSRWGVAVQSVLMKCMPHQYCNLYVVLARKPG